MDMLIKARNAAAGLLTNKMYTCKELYDRLMRKKYEPEICEQVVAEFVAAGYLDDRRYAEMYLADESALNAKGIWRIRQELFRKGIAASILDAVFDSCETDTESYLKEYVEQRHLADAVHSRKDLERLKARLARRGYSAGEINRCLSAYHFRFDEWD